MTDIVERLHGQVASDHIRGCMGRQYTCDCGYDVETENLLAEAAAEVERLRSLADNMGECNIRYLHEIERLRAALQDIAEDPYAVDGGAAEIARAALEPKPHPQEQDVEDGM